MLIPVQTPTVQARNHRHEKRLWHFGDRHPLSLGCTSCPDRALCGGLQIKTALFDCLGFCCGSPPSCDAVCRKRPEAFAQRVREIGGFSLDNVPRARVLQAPDLPALVPTIYHGDKRHGTFRSSSMVCLPLYQVICRDNGQTRYVNPQALAEGFAIPTEMPVILTGTADDSPLERWWSLGPGRRNAIRALVDLRVSMVTTPNFSLFTDQPRWDDMHGMKRIALVHEEFLSEGLPAALHVNARTERDWQRWNEYVAARAEVTHVAFEFGTGAGWAERIDWHTHQLVQLAEAASRPLHLVMRGGAKALPVLVQAYSGITFLDTSTFVKTIKRQRAKLTAQGVVDWVPCPTDVTEMLDNLFVENWGIVAASYARLMGKCVPPREVAG